MCGERAIRCEEPLLQDDLTCPVHFLLAVVEYCQSVGEIDCLLDLFRAGATNQADVSC